MSRVLLCLALLAGSRALLTAQTGTSGSPANNAAPVALGTIQGVVVDATGAAIQRATIHLESTSNGFSGKTESDSSGVFSIEEAPAGACVVKIVATGFAIQHLRVSVSAGQVTDLGQIALALAPIESSVQVTPSRPGAEAELNADEHQRLLGAIPNFLVTYRQDAPPLTVKQKYRLTFALVSDPASFAIAGVIAGSEQAADGYAGYGQGARGFGSRYGAAYGSFFVSNVISGAVLPALFKQDPRYFVKGQGPVRSRVWYALANSVVRKSDSGRWQPDYSGILGNLAGGAIANAYLPSADQNGVQATFQNAGIGIAANAAANLLQEFVFRRITPTARARPGATPSGAPPLPAPHP